MSIAERLFAKLRQDGECVVYSGARNAKGYGIVSVRAGLNVMAHRLAYELEHGVIPAGFRVMHSCDNPPCCNVRHLMLGTPRDNTRDMLSKQRESRGEQRYNNKLSADDVLDIRASSRTNTQLAQTYGVARETIRDIRARKRWKWLQ